MARSDEGAIFFGIFMALLTGVLVVMFEGNLAFALAPLGVLIAVWAIFRMPLGVTALLILFAALVFDNPQEGPGGGFFDSPLEPVGKLLYNGIEKSLGIPGIKFSVLEVLIVTIGVLSFFRGSLDRSTDSSAMRSSPLRAACIVAVGTIAFLEVWGIVRGGSIQHSLLQVRALLFCFILTLVLAPILTRPAYVKWLLVVFFAASFIRSSVGIYYWLTIVRAAMLADPEGEEGSGSYVMMHSDSILAAVVVVCLIILVYRNPRPSVFALAGVLLPWTGLFIIANNRRLAFVSIFLALAFVYFALDAVAKRRVHLTLAAMLPFMPFYVGAGWNSGGAWAKPVRTIKSVIASDGSQDQDASSATRDIENYNLIITMKREKLLGWGLGHEYVEQVVAYDISHAFDAYRYVPHNSVLWLWCAGGLIGFSAIWMVLAVACLLAIRVARYPSSSETERLQAMITIGAIVAYTVQAYGDMGLQSWMGSLIVGSSMAVTSATAIRLGLWPWQTDRGTVEKSVSGASSTTEAPRWAY